jgi:predicted NACHT family NTPase
MSQQPGIYLGYPFDQLFDRYCDLEYCKEDSGNRKRKFIPAIKLPDLETPGTGSIVISGAPGSGKSTLALQWAIKCASRTDNASNAAYFSLEHTVDEVISKAKPFG